MEYPRKVVLQDKNLTKLIREKGELVEKGRAESEIIENFEATMADFDKQMSEIDVEIQEYEKHVDLSALKAKADTITEEFNAVVAKMDGVKKEIYELMKSQIPTVLTDQFESLKQQKAAVEKQKGDHENARNKWGLKSQKWKDKIIPLVQKLVKPQLSEFEDIEGYDLDGEDIVVKIYNHQAEWEKAFRVKNKK